MMPENAQIYQKKHKKEGIELIETKLLPMASMENETIVKSVNSFIPDTIIHGSFDMLDEFKILWSQTDVMSGKFPADLIKENKICSYKTRIVVHDDITKDLIIDISVDDISIGAKPEKFSMINCGFIYIKSMDVVIGLTLNPNDMTFKLSGRFTQVLKSQESIVMDYIILKNYLNHAEEIANSYLHVWYCYQLTQVELKSDKVSFLKDIFKNVFLDSKWKKIAHKKRVQINNKSKYYNEIYLSKSHTILSELLIKRSDIKRIRWVRGVWIKPGKYRSGSWRIYR